MRGVDSPFEPGDVVWAPDPYRAGTNPRPWLVLAAGALPYPGEEHICAAFTTSDLPANVAVGDDWLAGRTPGRPSYCSPWVLGTVKHRAVADPQGRVSASFVQRIIDRVIGYLRGEAQPDAL